VRTCASCLDFLVGTVPADRDVQQARTISLSDDDVVLRRQQKMVGGVGLIDDVQWRTHVKFFRMMSNTSMGGDLSPQVKLVEGVSPKERNKLKTK
jgi:hypothetical protein